MYRGLLVAFAIVAFVVALLGLAFTLARFLLLNQLLLLLQGDLRV